MTDPTLKDRTKRGQYLVIGGMTAGITLILLWMITNFYFDRWGIATFTPAPFLPVRVAPGSPSYTYGIWLGLFEIYAVIGIPIAAIVIAEFFHTMWKFRDRPGMKDAPDKITEGRIPDRNRGRNSRTLLYTNLIIAALLFSLVAYSMPINAILLGPPPSDPDSITVEVIGHQWYWEFIYPDNTSMDGKAVLPINQEIIFKVTSADVMHDFAIPNLKVKVDAYAGHWNTVYTIIYDQGNYTAFCMELCGVGHADMTATIEVVSETQYAEWYQPPT